MIVSGLAILLLLFLIVVSARFGFSRLLTKYALVADSLLAANEAVRLTPSDAEARRARATILTRLRFLTEAETELDAATRLRPADDYLWLELGNVRDEVGDAPGAFAALDQAVQHAPYYAHTQWQRGNLLLRMGRYDEAFADLRRAAASNRTFLPGLIDLAWSLSKGDPSLTQRLIQIDSDYEYVLYTRFLAGKGSGPETLTQFQKKPAAFSADNRKDIVRRLLENHAYLEASEIWNSPQGKPAGTAIYDGGFEAPLAFDDVGFGWRISREHTKVDMALDTVVRQSGTKSLRITLNGDSNPGNPLLSQLVLVKPQQHYRINFAVKTSDLVAGALPLINVIDAAKAQKIGMSGPLPQGTRDWQTMSFEFFTLPDSRAVVISLQRELCGSSTCPIFGVLWLDSFSIEELNQAK